MAIQVTSHVARDFLQGSAYFNTVAKIVWEYVSNSLDNPKGNQAVHCRVQIGSGKVLVEDDAQGMSRADLERFFTMHAENAQRAAGKTVRGRFGTGKSAAFGLGSILRVTSVKEGRRNSVELRREDIDSAKDGQPFPVRQLIDNELTPEPSGTVIEVEGLKTKASDVGQTRAYIERRLGRFRGIHSIVVNNNVIEYEEPPFTEETVFVLDSGPLVNAAEEVRLTIRTSPTPLDEPNNGVDVLSKGNWHETTLAGLEREDHSQFLYGFVDIPALEDYEGPIEPFDNTRSGQLNQANPLVVELYAWVRASLDEVRLALIEKDRERRRSAEAKRLQKEADKIAEILNRDFDAWRSEFRRATGRLGRDLGHMVDLGSEGEEVLPGPGTSDSSFAMTGPEAGEGGRGPGPSRDGDEERPGSGLVPGSSEGSLRGGKGTDRRRRSGGFSIEYSPETESEPRSRYDENTRTIYINTDHPQIAAAQSMGAESRPFRQLSYEVAFTEYALALSMDMARAQGSIFDAQDAIVEAGYALDRIARLGASLYKGEI